MRELVTVGGVGLTIFALIAAGVATMFAAHLKALRGDRDDLTARVIRLQSERDDCETQLTAARRDLAAIGRVVTGEAHWVAIEQQLASNHDEVMAQLVRIARAQRKGDA